LNKAITTASDATPRDTRVAVILVTVVTALLSDVQDPIATARKTTLHRTGVIVGEVAVITLLTQQGLHDPITTAR
jgi:hypothetical protein